MDTLFIDSDNNEYSADDVEKCLREIGADDCQTLFIHSDIMFGRTPAGFKRKDYLETLYQILKSLGVCNIIVPTFTYSFCNNEIYDVCKSRTQMGALNEYIRKKEGRYRTHDPLLSLSVPDTLTEEFSDCSEHSLGRGSGLDRVHSLDGVKFLFLGARMGNCFTYVHYAEKMLDVPYRFDLEFTGQIIDESGAVSTRSQFIHTACSGVKPADFYYFEDYLEDNGCMKKCRLADKYVSCIGEKDAYREITTMIKNNINYFLEQPFSSEDLEHKYTKGLSGERITHC